MGNFTVWTDPVVPLTANAESFSHFFVVSHLIGATSLVILMAVAFFRTSIRRHPLWYNFCFSWIISALTYAMLALVGKQTGPLPSYGLCFVQSTLINACPVLAVYSLLALTVQLLLDISQASLLSEQKTLRTVILLMIPWFLFSIVLYAGVGFGIGRPVLRTVTYCHIKGGIFGNVASVLVILAFFACIVTEVFIARIIGSSQKAHGPELDRRRVIDSMLRLVALTICISASMVAAVILIVKPGPTSRNSADAIIAILPIASFIVFVSQPDLWKKGSRSESNPSELKMVMSA